MEKVDFLALSLSRFVCVRLRDTHLHRGKEQEKGKGSSVCGRKRREICDHKGVGAAEYFHAVPTSRIAAKA